MPLKRCRVPSCNNDSANSPEKLFLTIPKNFKRAKNWAKALKVPYSVGSGVIGYCCEDHFNLPADSMNWSYYKLIGRSLLLKPDVVPHLYIESPPKEKLDPQLSEAAKIIKSQNLQKRPSSTSINYGAKQLMRYRSAESQDETISEPVFYEIIGMQLTSTDNKSDCILPSSGSVRAAIDVGKPSASVSNCASLGNCSNAIFNGECKDAVVSEPLYLEVLSVRLTSSNIRRQLNKSTNLTRKFKAILPAISATKLVSSEKISNSIVEKDQLDLNNHEYKNGGLLRSFLLESSHMTIKNEQLDLSSEDYKGAAVSDPLMKDVSIDLNKLDNKNESLALLNNSVAGPNSDIPYIFEECSETTIKKEPLGTENSVYTVYLENVSMQLVPSEIKNECILTSNNLEPSNLTTSTRC